MVCDYCHNAWLVKRVRQGLRNYRTLETIELYGGVGFSGHYHRKRDIVCDVQAKGLK